MELVDIAKEINALLVLNVVIIAIAVENAYAPIAQEAILILMIQIIV